MKPMWDLKEARALIKKMEPEFSKLGWHIALGGSVLTKGSSWKDLDLIVYPHSTADRVMVRVYKKLRSMGWNRRRTTAQMRRYWKAKGSLDRKFVEVYALKDGRRVDVIYVW